MIWFHTISDRHKIIKLIILVYSIILSPFVLLSIGVV